MLLFRISSRNGNIDVHFILKMLLAAICGAMWGGRRGRIPVGILLKALQTWVCKHSYNSRVVSICRLTDSWCFWRCVTASPAIPRQHTSGSGSQWLHSQNTIHVNIKIKARPTIVSFKGKFLARSSKHLLAQYWDIMQNRMERLPACVCIVNDVTLNTFTAIKSASSLLLLAGFSDSDEVAKAANPTVRHYLFVVTTTLFRADSICYVCASLNLLQCVLHSISILCQEALFLMTGY